MRTGIGINYNELTQIHLILKVHLLKLQNQGLGLRRVPLVITSEMGTLVLLLQRV